MRAKGGEASLRTVAMGTEIQTKAPLSGPVARAQTFKLQAAPIRSVIQIDKPAHSGC